MFFQLRRTLSRYPVETPIRPADLSAVADATYASAIECRKRLGDEMNQQWHRNDGRDNPRWRECDYRIVEVEAVPEGETLQTWPIFDKRRDPWGQYRPPLSPNRIAHPGA